MRTRVFILAQLFAAWSGSTALAQPSFRMPPVRYEAPSTCPDRDFFVARMRARLTADRVRALTSLKLHVRLEASASDASGSVQIDRGTSRARRSLEGATCREVVEGLALIAALAVAAPESKTAASRNTLRGAAPSADGADDPAGPVTEPPKVQSDGDQGMREPRQSPPSAAAPLAAPSEDPRSPEPAAPRAEETNAPSDPRDEASDEPEPSSSAAPSVSLGPVFSLGAAALAFHGVTPSIRPGLQLQAALTLHGGAVDWTVRLAGRIALPEVLRSDDGTAEFSFLAGAVSVCATGALGNSRLRVDGCAVVEPGRLHAVGRDTGNPKSYPRVWLAVGGGAALGWQAASWLGVRAGGELLVPSRRDRMILADEELHHVPRVTFRLQLALEVPLG